MIDGSGSVEFNSRGGSEDFNDLDKAGCEAKGAKWNDVTQSCPRCHDAGGLWEDVMSDCPNWSQELRFLEQFAAGFNGHLGPDGVQVSRTLALVLNPSLTANKNYPSELFPYLISSPAGEFVKVPAHSPLLLSLMLTLARTMFVIMTYTIILILIQICCRLLQRRSVSIPRNISDLETMCLRRALT